MNNQQIPTRKPKRIICVQNRIIITLYSFNDVVHLPSKPFQIKVISGTARLETKGGVIFCHGGKSLSFAAGTAPIVSNNERRRALTVKIMIKR